MTENEPLKLYVWDDVLREYDYGVMFALAHDEDDARRLILESSGYDEESVDMIMQKIRDAIELPPSKKVKRFLEKGMQKDLVQSPRCVTLPEGFHISGSA